MTMKPTARTHSVHGDQNLPLSSKAAHRLHDNCARDFAGQFEELRALEYARLDRSGEVYLDYTGGGLYAESQLREHLDLLGGAVFGNPHSSNPTSSRSTELVERARSSILAYFRADPEEYAV